MMSNFPSLSQFLDIIPQEASCSPLVNMVIIVVSGPTNFVARQTVRQKWGSVVTNASCIKLLSILGHVSDLDLQEHIAFEASIHGDILQVNRFQDSWRASLTKTYPIFSNGARSSVPIRH